MRNKLKKLTYGFRSGLYLFKHSFLQWTWLLNNSYTRSEFERSIRKDMFYIHLSSDEFDNFFNYGKK